MNAFRGMAWVYKGPLNKRAFRKKFIKNKSKRVMWCDLRVDFESANNIFTMELKNINGFASFPVYIASINQGLEKTFPMYSKMYLRYTKALESRKKRFNNLLSKRKVDYNKTKALVEKERWESFVKNYFSNDEKKMSKKQWFDYYDYVVGHEQELLCQSDMSVNRFERMLVIKNYISCNGFGRNFLFDSAAVIQNIFFTDSADILLPIKQIYVLNKVNKIYFSADGSKGVGQNSINLGKSNSIVIIAVLRNDDIGIITSNEYTKNNFIDGERVRLKVKLLNKKLTTICQIFEQTGL